MEYLSLQLWCNMCSMNAFAYAIIKEDNQRGRGKSLKLYKAIVFTIVFNIVFNMPLIIILCTAEYLYAIL